ncbi:hypothetical protein SAMN04488063_0108 [Halopelagius inordinatus]|uniref:Uncharacterized protein n=1 Tax=Halopelagius inordinatus TaxID=553467 RepID=A0A1I2X461_9EURY|nr:hypothetical protein [Halopelagius inordinatus]SFH07729.1 hypothetical protein SAMN04488063_0108 [Halopelagius inordinatus]
MNPWFLKVYRDDGVQELHDYCLDDAAALAKGLLEDDDVDAVEVARVFAAE